MCKYIVQGNRYNIKTEEHNMIELSRCVYVLDACASSFSFDSFFFDYILWKSYLFILEQTQNFN